MAFVDFIPLKEYRVKKKSDGRIHRMFGFISFNCYGDQSKEKFTFYALTKSGVEIIPGGDAEVLPLRWWQKEQIVAGVIGGVIGTMLRELFGLTPHAIQLISRWIK